MSGAIEAEARMRLMYENLPISCIFFDENDNVRDCNIETLKLFRVKSVKEFVEKFYLLLPDEQAGKLRLKDTQRRVKNGERVVEEWVYNDFFGNEITAETTFVPIDNENKCNIICYVKDLSEIKKAYKIEKQYFDRIKIVYDKMPLCCHLWDKEINISKVNEDSDKLFGTFENLEQIFPIHQPDGSLSLDKYEEYVKTAMFENKVVFEWTFFDKYHDEFSAEVTMVKVENDNVYSLIAYIKDIREIKKFKEEAEAAIFKAKNFANREKILIESLPMAVNFWNRNLELIYCNRAALEFVGAKDMKHYLENFFEYVPKKQAFDADSAELGKELLKKAFAQTEPVVAEFDFKSSTGEIFSSEVSLIKAKYGNEDIVLTFKRDITSEKKIEYIEKEADDRMTLMLDIVPLASNIWDENYKIIDCNKAILKLFDFESKTEYIKNYFELAPLYQPDGRKTIEKIQELLKDAFNDQFKKVEWIYKKKDGELIPAEISFMCVNYRGKKIVITYVRDLRNLHESISMLDQLEKMAFTDSLTGIYNRRYFLNHIERTLTKFKKGYSLIMFDLDFFKKINDSFGHLAGDAVLKDVVDIITPMLRKKDIFARYGGEEFLILCGNTNSENILRLSQRIRNCVQHNKFIYKEIIIKVTISIGIGIAHENEDISVKEVINKADEALYIAKENGRNRVEIYKDKNTEILWD